MQENDIMFGEDQISESDISEAEKSEASEESEASNLNSVFGGNPAMDEAYGRKIESLKGEMEMLKQRLFAIDRGISISGEIKSLCSLIPGADLSLLCEEDFAKIENGESLVYRYLLAEKRAAVADEINKKNSLASPGFAEESSPQLYTLEEIKRMDRKTVRKNFDKVMKSLEKLN